MRMKHPLDPRVIGWNFGVSAVGLKFVGEYSNFIFRCMLLFELNQAGGLLRVLCFSGFSFGIGMRNTGIA